MPDCYRFGRFEVRPVERQVLVDGEVAALGARAFDLLLALIERRDRIVKKSELFDIVWPGLVVGENNMAVQVSALRRLLGPRAILTVPARGFRFALQVEGEARREHAPPPPASAPVRADRLPAPPLSLVGRAFDQAALESVLAQCRLVSVVGVAGVGKTSLALSAAHARQAALRDGAAWIDLATITDASLVPRLVSQALQLPVAAGGNELAQLVAQLRAMQLLLVLDNAEHLVEAAAQLAHAVMQGTIGVRICVTSQAVLRVDGERVFRLEALSVPEAGADPDDALMHGAVALFVDQAQALDLRFRLTESNVAGVIGLCRQLDGNPLAIKLAVARLPVFGVDGLVQRLSERFDWRSGELRSAPTRQQTLLAALDWSHGLLSTAERAVFRRLGVFVGGFTLDLAVVVAGDDALDEVAVVDALEALVNHSLVCVDSADVPRYRLLESPRAYALLKLGEAGEADTVCRRHADALLQTFERGERAYWELPDAAWLAEYGPEIDNLRAAIDWAAQHDGRLALAMLSHGTDLFVLLSLHHECRERFAGLADALDAETAPQTLALHCLQQARLLLGLDQARVQQLALRAAELLADAGNDSLRYRALQWVCISCASQEDEAWPILAEMQRLERPEWPPRLRRLRLGVEGRVLDLAGRAQEALAVHEASLALARKAGASNVVAGEMTNLAYSYMALGRYEEAVQLGRELLGSPRPAQGRTRLYQLGNTACALLLADDGNAAEARALLSEMLELSSLDGWDSFGVFSDVYAMLAVAEGRLETGARLIGHADRAHEQIGGRFPTSVAARARAWSGLEAAFDVPTLARLCEQGAALDPQTVCAMTLSPPAAQS